MQYAAKENMDILSASANKKIGWERKQMCQYIESLHLVLKWQLPNIPAAVCPVNDNYTTKEA